MSKEKVVVAMSGGVDSSITAAILVGSGYEVIGMMMRLWSEPGTESHNRCCTPDAMAKAKRVATILNIPFYAIDARSEFFNAVVNGFIDGYSQGITPNPCLSCNRLVRWGFLLKRAMLLGADYFATGHYARIVRTPGDHFQLHRAVDHTKDQSYVLYALNQDDLSRTLLPLGELCKPEVRQMAQKLNLPVADIPDSQDLCFLGGEDYRQFLVRNIPEISSSGPIVDTAGAQLGIHDGLAFYTIGQRRGLGISSTSPLYVIEKDISTNTLIVGTKERLERYKFSLRDVHWVVEEPPAPSFTAGVQIRYRAKEASCNIKILDIDRASVTLAKPIPGITPGQAAVFYNGDICLGGGIIQSVES